MLYECASDASGRPTDRNPKPARLRRRRLARHPRAHDLAIAAQSQLGNAVDRISPDCWLFVSISETVRTVVGLAHQGGLIRPSQGCPTVPRSKRFPVPSSTVGGKL